MTGWSRMLLYVLVAIICWVVRYLLVARSARRQAGDSGGAKPDTARVAARRAEITELLKGEESRLQALFGGYRDELAAAYRKAMATDGEAYVVVKLIDRDCKVDGESMIRLLVLYKENGHLDDYGLVPPGMEDSPGLQYEGMSGEYFWTNAQGDVEAPQLFGPMPEGDLVVQEWYAPSKYPAVYLVYVDMPRVQIDLR